MAKPVNLNGGRFWPNQRAAKDYYRTLRDRWPLNTPIRGQDHHDLEALLANHPEADQKIGCGVEHFTVRINMHGTTGFWLTRFDGSETDFSFLIAVEGRGKTLAQRWRAAARNAVNPTIWAFRDAASGASAFIKCALTGEVVPLTRSHVDHAPPNTFEAIVQDYVRGWPEDYVVDVLTAPRDGEQTTHFADTAVLDRFKRFHDERCVLRLVSARANLSVAKRDAA